MKEEKNERSVQNTNKTINERELEVLKFWNENKIFEKSLFENKGGKGNNSSYTFYDGPPFATGMPHHGHLMQSYLKDSIPRYQTMKGKYVRRVWGWDTHGLPIENLIEKELGLKSKKEIEEFGVDKFTKAAADSVLRYESEWKKIIPRIGRWVDMDNRYITLENTYTESCWWGFSELYKKGLVYEGYKVMHICPRCETPLAASEVAQGYVDLKDISVYAKFELVENPGTFLLAWTTTPWTLPGNTAIAINKDIVYAKIKYDNQILILAKDTVATVLKALPTGEGWEGVELLETFIGEKLIGKSYRPVFDYYNKPEILAKMKNVHGEPNGQNIYKIWHADFVTDTAGTGIAHEAPAFGEDDYNLAVANNVPTIIHLGMDGRFYPEVTDFAGERVKWKGETQATDKKICEFLAAQNKILKTEIITHSYPLCWRCDTPLLNYATTSWFVAVSKMRDKLVEENKKVYWVPENVRDGRMGQWLEGARDWALSRNRYWGAPLPVWKTSPSTPFEGGKGTEYLFIPASLKELQTRTRAKNKYTLIRHGETDSNKKSENTNEKSIASGCIDVVLGSDASLNDNGKKQISEPGLIKKLKDWQDGSTGDLLIFSSPYKRTLETAEILARNLGLDASKIIVADELKEWQVGAENNGKTWTEFYVENKGVNYLHNKMRGGEETKLDVQNRMANFINNLEEKYSSKNIILVTHKSPIACLLSRNSGEIFEFGTANMPDWHNAKNGEVVNLDWKPLPTDETGAVNFHLPHIDNLNVYDDAGNKMKREGGVFDCWYESGSMPYAQFHYPFENQELFKNNFPADFIAEAQDQTRGWFYTMLILGVGIFGQSPFKSVITSGMINAADGKKMSKRDKNYTDPLELVEKFGSDSIRYYILSSPVVKGESVKFTDLGIASVASKNVGRLLNVLSFYKMYDNLSSLEHLLPENNSDNVLDQYIFARLKQVKWEVTKGFEELFVDQAYRPIEKFIDDLSVWYLRRSRDRFKSAGDPESESEKKKVLQACKFVLREFSKVLAPIMPFTAEMIWQEIRIKSDPMSVHLAVWGESEELDEGELKTIQNMELVREMVTAILDERLKAKIKVRQPLAAVTFLSEKYSDVFADQNLLQQVKDETNIRTILFSAQEQTTPNASLAGGEQNNANKICVLDTNITEELKVEGTYRELVRLIQDKRKEQNLKVTDMISIELPDSMSEFEKEVVENKKEELKKECGLKDISFGSELKIVK